MNAEGEQHYSFVAAVFGSADSFVAAVFGSADSCHESQTVEDIKVELFSMKLMYVHSRSSMVL